MGRKPPRRSPLLRAAPRFSGRTTARLAARPRPRRRLRDVRWNVQWWAALTSVIAGLMSVPALIISLNALKISEQQRADALAQRAEDKSEQESAKAEADALRDSAFFRNITFGTDWYDALPNQESRAYLRNANPEPAIVYLFREFIDQDRPARAWKITMEPCSQATIKLPAVSERSAIEAAVPNPARTAELVWISTPSVITDPSKATPTPLKPDRVIRGIIPCASSATALPAQRHPASSVTRPRSSTSLT